LPAGAISLIFSCLKARQKENGGFPEVFIWFCFPLSPLFSFAWAARFFFFFQPRQMLLKLFNSNIY